MDCLIPCFNEFEDKNKKTRKQLKKIRKEREYRRKHEVLTLFLGADESRNTAFIEQLYTEISDEEKRLYIPILHHNLYFVMNIMIGAMERLKISFHEVDNESKVAIIRELDFELGFTLSAPHMKYINQIWEDPGMKECYSRCHEFQLTDSTKYFLNAMPRISQADYLPTLQDILHVRVPTEGMKEFIFFMAGCGIPLTIRMMKIDGERHDLIFANLSISIYFENVTSIIFLADLSEYDQIHVETGKNRMEESKALFRTIITYPWFKNSSVILFLNNTDLVEEKIMYSHLMDYFPEFDGPQHDALAAREFILKMFMDLNPNPENIYYHFTCAKDREKIRFVDAAIKDTIIVSNLKNCKIKV